MYYLFNIVSGGWLTRTSTYTSELADAQPFDKAEAIARARASRDHTGRAILIPVSIQTLHEVME